MNRGRGMSACAPHSTWRTQEGNSRGLLQDAQAVGLGHGAGSHRTYTRWEGPLGKLGVPGRGAQRERPPPTCSKCCYERDNKGPSLPNEKGALCLCHARTGPAMGFWLGSLECSLGSTLAQLSPPAPPRSHCSMPQFPQLCTEEGEDHHTSSAF